MQWLQEAVRDPVCFGLLSGPTCCSHLSSVCIPGRKRGMTMGGKMYVPEDSSPNDHILLKSSTQRFLRLAPYPRLGRLTHKGAKKGSVFLFVCFVFFGAPLCFCKTKLGRGAQLNASSSKQRALPPVMRLIRSVLWEGHGGACKRTPTIHTSPLAKNDRKPRAPCQVVKWGEELVTPILLYTRKSGSDSPEK